MFAGKVSSFTVAVVVSLLLHACMVALLVVHWEPERKQRKITQPKYVQATLLKLEEKAKPKPKPPGPKAAPKPAPKPKPEEPKPAPKEAPSEAFSDLLKQEMEAIKQDEAEAMPAAESSETAQQLDEILQYKAIIQQTMKRYWARPPSARNGMVVTLSISLLPGGEVKSVVIDRSSGNSAFDNAAVQAVQKAGRFSVSPDPQLFDRHFRNFKMRFKPDDLRY